MINPYKNQDFDQVHEIINDASLAYKGVIPDDCWHEPYMPKDELRAQISDGVQFYCYIQDNQIAGVMGIQDKGPVDLIRHAYVRTKMRNGGIGGILLQHLKTITNKPVLIGTWKDAFWAVNFYRKHGFTLVSEHEKNVLLKTYWKISSRQVETSVVLADQKYFDLHDKLDK